MSRVRFSAAVVGFAIVLPFTATSQPNVPLSSRVTQPKPVPIAETSLLMEAMAEPNLRGLEKLLAEKPATPEAWKFARGQAILIGETGNLLMLRPPKSQGQESWLKASAELRDTANKLAKQIATEDWAGSKAGLIGLAASCNKCHETFRVRTKITVFREAEK